MIGSSPTVGRGVSGHTNPFPFSTDPVIGISTLVRFAVRRCVKDTSVNDREIPKEADLDRICCQTGIVYRPPDYLEKTGFVEKRGVWIRTFEILGKDFFKALGIAILYCRNVVLIKDGECFDVVIWHFYLLYFLESSLTSAARVIPFALSCATVSALV